MPKSTILSVIYLVYDQTQTSYGPMPFRSASLASIILAVLSARGDQSSAMFLEVYGQVCVDI